MAQLEGKAEVVAVDSELSFIEIAVSAAGESNVRGLRMVANACEWPWNIDLRGADTI